MDETDLNQAMDRYADGHSASFAVLHRGLAGRLQAFLTRMSGSTTTADDLLQETFLRMHRARATFQKGSAVMPWAYAIARNVYLDFARAAKSRRTERLPSDPGPDASDEGSASAESEAIARQAARVVEEVLAALPAAQREAFVLIRYVGLKV